MAVPLVFPPADSPCLVPVPGIAVPSSMRALVIANSIATTGTRIDEIVLINCEDETGVFMLGSFVFSPEWRRWPEIFYR
jgi:hypothetical protein